MDMIQTKPKLRRLNISALIPLCSNPSMSICANTQFNAYSVWFVTSDLNAVPEAAPMNVENEPIKCTKQT